MNGPGNPADWEDFTYDSIGAPAKGAGSQYTKKLPPSITLTMTGLPIVAEPGHPVIPLNSDELLKRSKSIYPVYAFGYNWLQSNKDGAMALKARILKVISENSSASVKCEQVILVTHSMGGLVARACSDLPDMAKKILGVVHGVMPATGAAVAYRRCKVGMRDESYAGGLVIGSNGAEVTAVFAQAPGALQLLPSAEYGLNWLQLTNPAGKIVASLPKSDPYEEIYLQRNKWWGLIRPEWLAPVGGVKLDWDEFKTNIELAKAFHGSISGKYHHNTFVFYGGGTAKTSFAKIRWEMKKGLQPASGTRPGADQVYQLSHEDLRTDGYNRLYVGGEEEVISGGEFAAPSAIQTSFFEAFCSTHDGAGDGTVPSGSGAAPRNGGGKSILQQFELAGIEHEPAYKKYPVAQAVAYYAITKLASMAVRL